MLWVRADRPRAEVLVGQRFDLDRSGAPVIFGPILDAPDDPGAREAVADLLVRRLLHRAPAQSDIDSLAAFYDVVAAQSNDVVRDGSVGACVIVATSTEALFY